jgi:hypothetical protein
MLEAMVEAIPQSILQTEWQTACLVSDRAVPCRAVPTLGVSVNCTPPVAMVLAQDMSVLNVVSILLSISVVATKGYLLSYGRASAVPDRVGGCGSAVVFGAQVLHPCCDLRVQLPVRRCRLLRPLRHCQVALAPHAWNLARTAKHLRGTRARAQHARTHACLRDRVIGATRPCAHTSSCASATSAASAGFGFAQLGRTRRTARRVWDSVGCKRAVLPHRRATRARVHESQARCVEGTWYALRRRQCDSVGRAVRPSVPEELLSMFTAHTSVHVDAWSCGRSVVQLTTSLTCIYLYIYLYMYV